MKVITTLHVSAAQFYKYLLTQIRSDIAKTMHTNALSFEELEGYTYTKALKRKKSKPMKLHIKIGPLIENRYYELNYETGTASNRYFYDIHELGDKEIEVTYVEENNAHSMLSDWIYRMRVSVHQKKLEKKVVRTLIQIEWYILEHEDEFL